MAAEAVHDWSGGGSGGGECALSKQEADRVLSEGGDSGGGLFASGLALFHGVGVWPCQRGPFLGGLRYQVSGILRCM